MSWAVELLRRLSPHRHRWTHSGKPVRTLDEIPDASLFYRLDCECGQAVDGVLLKGLILHWAKEKKRPRVTPRMFGFDD
jgi:hypothetical protein